MTKARILADYVAGGTTAAEFDYMDGVTSNVQTQLDAKAPTKQNYDVNLSKVSASTVDIDAGYLTLIDSANKSVVLGTGVASTACNLT